MAVAGKENSSLEEESWGGQHGTFSERVERAEAWEAKRPRSILPLILIDSVMFGLSDPPLFTCEMGTGPSAQIVVVIKADSMCESSWCWAGPGNVSSVHEKNFQLTTQTLKWTIYFIPFPLFNCFMVTFSPPVKCIKVPVCEGAYTALPPTFLSNSSCQSKS